jgi:hypothetical protein
MCSSLSRFEGTHKFVVAYTYIYNLLQFTSKPYRVLYSCQTTVWYLHNLNDTVPPRCPRTFFLGQCVPWTMCPLYNVSFGQCVPWTMYPLDNASLWQCVLWTMRPLDNVFLGQCVPWTKRPWPKCPCPGRIQEVDNHSSYSQKLGYPRPPWGGPSFALSPDTAHWT